MIDAHTHCFPDALAPRALSKTDLYGGVYETDATISGQIRLAEKEGLRKVVVLHVANRPDSMHHVNDFAVSVNGMAGKVISFASIHPHAPDAAEEVERLYSLGIRGIKFQPIRQGFFMDEPCCEPIFRKIGELGMMTVNPRRPLHSHEGISRPAAATVARYIDCFQGAPVVLSHLGGMFLSEDEIREAAKPPCDPPIPRCASATSTRTSSTLPRTCSAWTGSSSARICPGPAWQRKRPTLKTARSPWRKRSRFSTATPSGICACAMPCKVLYCPAPSDEIR